MRPSLSLRSILVVALLLAGGFAGASSCARTPPASPPPDRIPLDDAVRRTVAAGSSRIAATITNDAGAVTVTGLTSWREARSVFRTEVDGAPPVEVRVTPSGTWLRARPDGPWDLVPPALVTTAGTTPDWEGLLTALQPSGSRRDGPLRATHAGAPATVELDDEGRIRRLRIDRPTGHLDLRLSDHGIEVDVVDP